MPTGRGENDGPLRTFLRRLFRGDADLPLGTRGEKLAARFLRRAGFKLLARNYRCPAGEADLIALDGRTLVFAEVKTRARTDEAAPEANVDARKQQRYRKVARYYLSRHDAGDSPVRFDVLAVVLPPEPRANPRIRHIPDAF
jgi:putative endonuclease